MVQVCLLLCGHTMAHQAFECQYNPLHKQTFQFQFPVTLIIVPVMDSLL